MDATRIMGRDWLVDVVDGQIVSMQVSGHGGYKDRVRLAVQMGRKSGAMFDNQPPGRGKARRKRAQNGLG